MHDTDSWFLFHFPGMVSSEGKSQDICMDYGYV